MKDHSRHVKQPDTAATDDPVTRAPESLTKEVLAHVRALIDCPHESFYQSASMEYARTRVWQCCAACGAYRELGGTNAWTAPSGITALVKALRNGSLRALTLVADTQTACTHPPGSRTCAICTLDDADESSPQAVAARALKTRRYSGGADPGRTP